MTDRPHVAPVAPEGAGDQPQHLGGAVRAGAGDDETGTTGGGTDTPIFDGLITRLGHDATAAAGSQRADPAPEATPARPATG